MVSEEKVNKWCRDTDDITEKYEKNCLCAMFFLEGIVFLILFEIFVLWNMLDLLFGFKAIIFTITFGVELIFVVGWLYLKNKNAQEYVYNSDFLDITMYVGDIKCVLQVKVESLVETEHLLIYLLNDEMLLHIEDGKDVALIMRPNKIITKYKITDGNCCSISIVYKNDMGNST